MKRFISISLYSIAIVLASCNDAAKKQDENKNPEHQEDGHVHTYACPMHPEVTGKEGDKCPKCGMPLEHNDEAAVQGNYRMEFTSDPATIEAGKEAVLKLIPKNKDDETVAVPLDAEHEKKIHLILVSDDLDWFNHIHPEYNADGSYTVKETFPSGGNYILYADYKPSGSNHQLEKINLNVKGSAKAAKQFIEQNNVSTSGNFTVTLKPDDGKFIAGKSIHFDGVFQKDGKPFDVNQLQNYLGAKGHMVGIHTQSKEYIHLHPEVENTILHFHTTLPDAGLYRVWLQFMADDKLYTTDFVINAEQDAGGTAAAADHSHGTHSH